MHAWVPTDAQLTGFLKGPHQRDAARAQLRAAEAGSDCRCCPSPHDIGQGCPERVARFLISSAHQTHPTPGPFTCRTFVPLPRGGVWGSSRRRFSLEPAAPRESSSSRERLSRGGVWGCRRRRFSLEPAAPRESFLLCERFSRFGGVGRGSPSLGSALVDAATSAFGATRLLSRRSFCFSAVSPKTIAIFVAAVTPISARVCPCRR